MSTKRYKNKLLSIVYCLLSNKNGFTLIELLVVFSVVAILAGIGIAAFVEYSRSQQVNQTANNIKLLLNEAKFNSLSSVKTAKSENGEESCGSNTLIGYTIVVAGNDQVKLNQVCENSGTAELKSINLPSSLVINASSTCIQVGFDSLSSTVRGTPCSIVITGYGQSKTLLIDVQGNVSIQ